MSLLCKKNISIALISIILLLPFPVAGKPTEAEIKKKQIEQIENDLKLEREKYLKYDVKEKDLLEQLTHIETEISEKKKSLDELESEINLKKTELSRQQKTLNEIQSELDITEELLARRMVAFYKNAKRGYLRVLLSTDDLNVLNHNMKYLRVIMHEDREVMNTLGLRKTEYSRQMADIKGQIDAVLRLEEAENQGLNELKQALEKEVLLLARIHNEKEFYGVAVNELQSAADSMKETIANLESISKRQKIKLPSNFGKAKGKLPLPLKGKILKNVKKTGERAIENNKGIYIDAPSGTQVMAVFSGRVDYSGVLKGYGQVIVINHGERYFTISAYLHELNKNKGDTVSVGDVIGYVGEAGLSTGPALYFEIRKGDENLNPLKWLKVN
ncbi:MAG: peptidoglycan DD-metalloendopeptidase family protein [Deltaproteobacteria bacterium]|nr:peptidoglycan DD-metalloendopeptidase family protein [Deltaproteobacteria bacterium]